MAFTLDQICKKINVEYSGDGRICVTHICGLDKIAKGGVAYLSDPNGIKNLPTPDGVFRGPKEGLETIQMDPESVIIVPKGVTADGRNFIFSDDPLLTQIEISRYLHPERIPFSGVHSTAAIGSNVSLGADVVIGPGCVIEDNVVIGAGTVLRGGVVVMRDSQIGCYGRIYPNVTICENCRIGDDVIIHPNAVIGSDGFGFCKRNGKNVKIPQVGNVIIGNRVEIGAGVAIDRARYYSTILEDGCKLDNQIHIAHNVVLGEEALMAAQTAIAGSSIIGANLMMAGRSGIKDNISVGKNVTVMTTGIVTSNTPDHSVIAGFPGRPLKKWKRTQALLGRLDKIYEKFKKLK